MHNQKRLDNLYRHGEWEIRGDWQILIIPVNI